MKQIDWTKWAAIAEILSAIAIVITLVYLGLQTRYLASQTQQLSVQTEQNTTATRLAVIQGYSEHLSDIDAFLVGNREFAEFLERIEERDLEFGDAELSGADEIQLRAWARWQLRAWESAYNLFTVGDPDSNRLRRHIRGQLRVAPRNYEIWQGRTETFSDEFNELMQEIGSELELQ